MKSEPVIQDLDIQSGRPATIWRVLAFWGLALLPLLLWGAGIRIVAAVMDVSSRQWFPLGSHRTAITGSILMLIGGLFASQFCMKRFEKKRVRDFLNWHPDRKGTALFGTYFMLGGCVVSLILLVQILTGSVSITLNEVAFSVFLPAALFHAADFAIASLAEELTDRGYVLRVIAMRRPWLAVVITSLLFALTHIGVGWLSWLSLVNIFMMGCVLALVFLKTGSIWSVWGFHFGLNLFEGVIYQYPVKGYEDLFGQVFDYVLNGPALLTGSDAGMTGSLSFTIVALILLAYYVRRLR